MPTAESLFKALADMTRHRLLQLLSAQELSVKELVDVLGQPQSTVSRHLKVLHDAGLVVDRRAGAAIRYVAVPPVIRSLDGGSPDEEGNINGPRVTLRDRLLDWVRQEGVDAEIQRRLEDVLRRRRETGADFFETLGGRWDHLRIEAFGEVFHFEALASLLPADWTVADIGTGTGYLLGVLARHFRRVIAVDPAETMLEQAKRRPELRGHRNVTFRQGSLADLPLKDREVDLAIACLVLHHVPQPEQALVEIRRCLAATGRVLIIEQASHGNAAFQDRMGDCWRGFEPGQLGEWLEAAGFADISSLGLSTARPKARHPEEIPRLHAVTARVACPA